MTIITGGTTQQKDDLPSPPEVIEDYEFLIDNEKNDEKKIVPLEFKKSQAVVVNVTSGQCAGFLPLGLRQRRQRSVWLMLFSLFVLVGLILACVCLYKKMIHENETRQFVCGVRYHEVSPYMYDELMGPRASDHQGILRTGLPFIMPDHGEFEQSVEIEEYFEKIVVPTIGDTKRATILHDFNVNYTAIIDKEQGHCFLLPLNRSLVLPPKDFWDLLVKLKSGYYVPDAGVVREDYRVVTPSVMDFTEFGVYIAGECHYYSTYRLVRDGQPIAMAKRSACEFAGERFCLGDGGLDRMLCINIKDCI